MSLRKRLLLAARTELKAAFRKLTSTRNEISESIEEELRAAEIKLEQAQNQSSDSPPQASSKYPLEISRAYANLELPIGASADEVKAAYRRLLRRYHPDRHHFDADKEVTANELTRKLKDAHDELLKFLGPS